MRGATGLLVGFLVDFTISIHAPRAGRDKLGFFRGKGAFIISIHAPRAGRDIPLILIFYDPKYFNPRAPCGARRSAAFPHVVSHQFQSTRPVRGATGSCFRCGSGPSDFNPRAPCGARPTAPTLLLSRFYFNPRAPCGARLNETAQTAKVTDFNPRAPCGARRMAKGYRAAKAEKYFNPRAPCGARRMVAVASQYVLSDFNPRAPCGARHVRKATTA